MNLFLNKFLSNIPQAHPIGMQQKGFSRFSLFNNNDKDTFEKTCSPVDINFTGQRGSGSTKKGDVLKELDNITCPYSGVKMITPKNMDRIEACLAKCDTISEQLDILNLYRPCMQKLEKQVYQVLKGYEINKPDGNINDCLRHLKPDCLSELRMAEIKVLDDVDKTSNKLDAKTALEVRKITTNARKIIIEDNQDKIFKRKDLLTQIYDVTKDYPNQKIVNEMWEKANNLPKSTNNFDAFVVKYANRSPIEVASRLLRPSVASVEHIRPANPDSLDIEAGKNDLSNFMTVARDWNSGRSNTPLPEFIKEHPSVINNSQKYINDIIKSIHKGSLEDCNWYPYVIKERLYNESEGLINVSLEKYKIPKENAFEYIPEDILETYNDLLEKNKSISNKEL